MADCSARSCLRKVIATGSQTSAALTLRHRDGTVHRHAVIGDGPIDAVFKAIEHITGIDVTLRDYRLRSVTVGEDAQGEAHVEAEYEGRVITGRGVSTDIIEASALAFVQVINRLSTRQQARLNPQTEAVAVR